LRFYRDILGFEVVSEEDGAWHLAVGEARLLLLPVAQNARRPPEYCSEPCVSFDLVVPDLAGAKDYLQSQGVEIDQDYPPSEAMFVIRDPDGLPLEVVRHNPGSEDRDD
jgi:catechol-2,3-dioxygenase